MEIVIARQILETLAQGINPITGEAMPEDSPYNAAPVIRALHSIARALDADEEPAAGARGAVLLSRAAADACERFLSGFEDDTDTGNAEFVAAPLAALRAVLKRPNGRR